MAKRDRYFSQIYQDNVKEMRQSLFEQNKSIDSEIFTAKRRVDYLKTELKKNKSFTELVEIGREKQKLEQEILNLRNKKTKNREYFNDAKRELKYEYDDIISQEEDNIELESLRRNNPKEYEKRLKQLL